MSAIVGAQPLPGAGARGRYRSSEKRKFGGESNLSAEPIVVLDASALLAFLLAEPGSEVVEPILKRATMSRVNVAEVLQKAAALGLSPARARQDLVDLGLRFESFEEEVQIADLYPRTHRLGLSLGDRACLSLGLRLRLPILHAERRWTGLDLGVELRNIRPKP
jgi:PIN domain nuclease of toxin-antitoxin system